MRDDDRNPNFQFPRKEKRKNADGGNEDQNDTPRRMVGEIQGYAIWTSNENARIPLVRIEPPMPIYIVLANP